LQDLARTFDRSGLFGLAEFIARLGDLVGNQAREEQAATQIENADVVRMMTIHQAKGLEFPVVIVPDLAATGHGGGRPIAQWDRRFGCVARPPVEEGEAEFTDFGWQLWKAQNDLEEWQEDLRTLYVACTRAEDYLILSSSLPDPYQPAGPWMQTLAERFDMETGRCLAADVKEGHRPLVQAYDRNRFA
jgi:ATP-dependent helicase/nuclease subunit A